MKFGSLDDFVRAFRGVRVWECPCGNFRVVAKRRSREDVIEHALGEHYLECVVAQADAGLRALVDEPPSSE